MASKPRAGAIAGAYAAWLGLAALAGVAALQSNVLILYLAALVIDNPALRPSGWSSATLVNIQRLTGLVLGSLWLMGILWMENSLRSAAQEGDLLRRIGQLAGALAGLLIAIYGILWLAG